MDLLSPAALGFLAMIAGALLALCAATGAWLARCRDATTREVEPPELVSFRARLGAARARGATRRPALMGGQRINHRRR